MHVEIYQTQNPSQTQAKNNQKCHTWKLVFASFPPIDGRKSPVWAEPAVLRGELHKQQCNTILWRQKLNSHSIMHLILNFK